MSFLEPSHHIYTNIHRLTPCCSAQHVQFSPDDEEEAVEQLLGDLAQEAGGDNVQDAVYVAGATVQDNMHVDNDLPALYVVYLCSFSYASLMQRVAQTSSGSPPRPWS